MAEQHAKTEPIKVLNLSTHDEDCGIGKYQEDFVRLLKDDTSVESVFYATSPNIIRTLYGGALEDELHKFRNELKAYDVLHIQHEFGFFHDDGEGLGEFVDIAKELHKKIVITIHTAPSLVYHPVIRGGGSVRAVAGYYKRLYKNKQILKKRLKPFLGADKIITLNPHTTRELIELVGVSPDVIHQTMIPVELNHVPDGDKGILRQTMDAKSEDIILATVGFLSDKKGTDAAIKSLSFLPKNYKLAILGGINPVSGRPEVYDRICDLVVELGLQDRVYISGYISDDRVHDQLVSGADIALYPYDPDYYRLASSAAVNTAINNQVPVISYPAESFKEINRRIQGAITVTASPNYYELVRAVKAIDATAQLRLAKEYAHEFSIEKLTSELVELYRPLV